MKRLIVLAILLLAETSWGQSYPIQKYNVWENRFETTYSDSVLIYNPYTNRSQYVTPRYPGQLISPSYNVMEDKWELPDSGNDDDAEEED